MLDMSKNNSKDPELSSDILKDLFEGGNSPLSEQFLRWKIWKRWGEFVGDTIAAISEPVSYRRGILYVWVKNSSWMQQMIFMIDPMKEAINKKLNLSYVRTIYLTLDRKSVPNDGVEIDQLKSSVDKISRSSR